jgi:hypothetical protein
MDFGSDTKHHLPRIGSLRLFADFPAGLKIVIDCLRGGFLEVSDIVTLKADYIGDTCNLADKQIVLGVEFDASAIPVVDHGVHGVTPIWIENSLVAVQDAQAARCRLRGYTSRGLVLGRTRPKRLAVICGRACVSARV